MTDRDHFAAAALTGLIAVMRDESIGEICESAYGWADAMLRERGNRPVTEPMPKEKRAEVSSEPAAWATFYPNGSTASVYVGRKPTHAEPLYRKPQPTLTDAEREAIEAILVDPDSAPANSAATLRGLLERLR